LQNLARTLEIPQTVKQMSMFAITNVVGLNDDHVWYCSALFQTPAIVPTFLLRLSLHYTKMRNFQFLQKPSYPGEGTCL